MGTLATKPGIFALILLEVSWAPSDSWLQGIAIFLSSGERHYLSLDKWLSRSKKSMFKFLIRKGKLMGQKSSRAMTLQGTTSGRAKGNTVVCLFSFPFSIRHLLPAMRARECWARCAFDLPHSVTHFSLYLKETSVLFQVKVVFQLVVPHYSFCLATRLQNALILKSHFAELRGRDLRSAPALPVSIAAIDSLNAWEELI